jgi:hypothetical protein
MFDNYYYLDMEIYHHQPTLLHFQLFQFLFLLDKYEIFSRQISFYKQETLLLNQKLKLYFHLYSFQKKKSKHFYMFVHKYEIKYSYPLSNQTLPHLH